MKIAVFCEVAPCSLVEVYRRFRGAYFLYLQIALVMEAVSSSEASGRNNPEDSHHRDNSLRTE
jgi:hypothetical protein